MSRENTIYAIYYSYVLHRIFSVITGRIDKVLTFCLLLLGSSVMASIGNPLFTGLCIATIAAVQNAFKFGAECESSRVQALRYVSLYTNVEDYDDKELLSQHSSIQKHDSTVWSSLETIAEYRTDMVLKGDSNIKMTTLEKALGFFC
ncbi:hypothetical protein SGGMMB4_01740 [Sodalis glossinidius str. 'morsitans']|uniref:Uncharacterized protein n=1 Tax=Sodalis glossinidius (strain morsitans) TaxID=343509 RepID=A0A193QHC4_SODGM|nr:hypothetical protein [Sodalis glossinidius]CRL44572.1 hypothetical protein SGGMMB4_01740 [Sodalis glossinidius str. 'morsitans']